MSSLFIPHGKISPTLSLVPNLTWTTKQMSLSARVARCGSWWQGSSGVRLEGKSLPAAHQPGWLDTAGTAFNKLRRSSRPMGVTVFHRPPPGGFPLPMPTGTCTFRHRPGSQVQLVIFPRKESYLMRGLGSHVQKSTNQKLQLIKSILKKFPTHPVQPTVSEAMFSLESAPQSKGLGYPTPETLAENKEVTDYNEIISFKFFKYWFLWQIFLFVRNRPQGWKC